MSMYSELEMSMSQITLSEFCSIPAIVALCYGFIEVLKRTFQNDEKLKNAYPLISALFGCALGVIAFLTEPDLMMTDSVLSSALTGMVSGLSATGSNEVLQRMKNGNVAETIDDSPAKYYITGDKHRHFDRLIEFCKNNKLRQKDVVVILGDSGFNYYGDARDDKLKAKLAKVNVTLFCLHGNKENRAQNISTYGIRTFCGGNVYYEPKYPNIFFAKDGEVYNFNGKEFMVVGGAHSVDKIKCEAEGLPYWEDEMPSDEIKALAEKELAEREYKIDGFLTHTCPISCLPTEMFISTKREGQPKTLKVKKKNSVEYPLDIDRSTEEWLEKLKEQNAFDVWYCGHYHIDKELGKVKMMHKQILPFCVPESE